MNTIVILALDGMMDSGLAIILDTFRTAQAFQARGGKAGVVKLRVAAYGKTVTTGGGMRLAADLTFGQVAAQRPDWVVVPGLGLVSEEGIAGRLAQADAKAALALLRSLPASTQVAAACSSVFLLAETGLLADRHVTMTWWLAHHFRARYPEVRLDETRMLVRDARYLTCGSAFAQLDLALAVTAETMGQNVAHLCSRYLLIDQRPSQARYMIQSHVRQSDPTVAAAERWIDARLDEPISVSGLAAALAVSPKTLARRIEAASGVSPVKFIQRRRLLKASHLIESTGLSIEAVAAKVGYQDATALRKLIKREFGTTPVALRHQ